MPKAHTVKYIEQLTLRDLNNVFHQYFEGSNILLAEGVEEDEDESWKRFWSICKTYCSIVERI